jgi:hypothetical protein
LLAQVANQQVAQPLVVVYDQYSGLQFSHSAQLNDREETRGNRL